jgi:hypothetical protein
MMTAHLRHLRVFFETMARCLFTKRIVTISLAVLLITLLFGSGCPAAEIHVGDFTSKDLDGWKSKSFKDETQYTFVKEGDATVLKAYSKSAASGLFKKIKVNPREYPVIRWSWKIDHTLKKEDAARKDGDDFAARVYVIFPSIFFWRTKAIIYVWSAKLPKGSSMRNPYSSNVIFVPVESGDEQVGKWVHEERNYFEDYRKLFGGDPPKLGAVAVMTDTDNTSEEATAWYGDIYLAQDKLKSTPE